MYIRFNTRPITHQKIVGEDVVIDLDEHDHLVGIEIINVDLYTDSPQQLIYEVLENREKTP